MLMRACRSCGQLVGLWSVCPVCGPARPPQVSSTRRGYGVAHQRLRKRWAPQVAAGLVACARCGRPIAPGEPWDLGHDDHDRALLALPEHRACNRATAGRRPGVRVRSRWW